MLLSCFVFSFIFLREMKQKDFARKSLSPWSSPRKGEVKEDSASPLKERKMKKSRDALSSAIPEIFYRESKFL